MLVWEGAKRMLLEDVSGPRAGGEFPLVFMSLDLSNGGEVL